MTATDETAASTAPAVQEQAPAPAVRDPQLDYSARLGMWLAAAESNSDDPRTKGMAAALRIEYARLLGLPPHAASEIHVIKGNLSVSAKLCRALARERGVKVERADETPESCTAVVRDLATGEELGRTTYTMEQAKRAGVVKDGSNWTKFPDRMLWARASKRALDDHAPWVTVGVLTDDDVEDAGWGRELRAQVAATGADVVSAEDAFEASDAAVGESAASSAAGGTSELERASSEDEPLEGEVVDAGADDSAQHDPAPADAEEQGEFPFALPAEVKEERARDRRAAGTDPDA